MTFEITTVGLDLAKNVFLVHAIDAAGAIRVRRQLRRGEVLRFFGSLSPCLVGLEACASSHHWAREIAALGHEVKMMPPAYVKPYVKRGNEPPRLCWRLQLLRRWSHDEQDNEQVFA